MSGLEMAQNSARLQWTPAEVDEKLQSIMKNAYQACYETGLEYGDKVEGEKVLPSLVVGANISGFIKVCTRFGSLFGCGLRGKMINLHLRFS